MIELAVIAPDERLRTIVSNLQCRIATPIGIYEGYLQEAVSLARKLENEGVKVIVSRGGTSQMIRQAGLSTYQVDIPITEYDVLQMLAKAKFLGGKVGVVGFRDHTDVASQVAPYLDLPLELYPISSVEESDARVRQAVHSGCRVILGAKRAVQLAKTLGVESVQLQSSEQSVLKALEEAGRMLTALKAQMRSNYKLSLLLNTVSYGVIYVDAVGRIQHMNRAAMDIVGITGENLRADDRLSSYLGSSILPLTAGKGNTEKLCTIQGNRYAVTIQNVAIETEQIGRLLLLQEVQKLQRLEQKIRKDLVRKGFTARYHFEQIIANAPAATAAVKTAQQYATSNSTVLLYGESGTGKEMFAQSIHNASSRAEGPFVAINCAALSETLLESELFGYVEGAFTGAKKGGKVGLFELAHQGTLFLDEIGEIPMSVQARLLRAIEERQIMRVGDDKYIPVDVRIICATNKDLYERVRSNAFREDLYFRINVLRLDLPPLRTRKEDIPALCQRLLAEFPADDGEPWSLSPAACVCLEQYTFPGNIRELRNIIERLTVVSGGHTITEEMVLGLSDLWRDGNGKPSAAPRVSRLEEGERRLIEEALQTTGGNKTRAAELLGISKATLWRKQKSWNTDQ